MYLSHQKRGFILITLFKNANYNGNAVDIIACDGIISDILPHSEDTNIEGAVSHDIDGKDILPGLFDIHAHGCLSFDITEGTGRNEMCAHLAQSGTTSWLPTTMTASHETLLHSVNEVGFNGVGCDIVGFHLEGPYVSEKAAGAQDRDFIRLPNIDEFREYKNVKMITVAPEQPGSMDFIRRASADGVIISLGHTDTDYDTALEAINNGAKCLTHTFNAMQPLHHRKPGPIGAASEKGIWAQIICDGVHIHKASVLAAYKLFGSKRLTLISDAIRPAGLPEGTVSESGGIPVKVRDGAVYLDGTDTLAGSGSTLWHCVTCAVKMGIDFDEAVRMATETPASLLGIKKGKIAEGYDADLLIINDDMTIGDVIISGKRYL